MNNLIHTEALKDKSLWLAVLVPALVMLSKFFGLDMDAGTITAVVGPAITYILASKAKQAHITGKSVESVEDAMKLLNMEKK